jgi:lysophospholipase L1-like esterase
MYGHSVFHGFVEGEVVGAPAGSGRLIEVIGDSISAGYGSLGTDIHPPWDVSCPFSLDTQSSFVSYSAILGRAFDAEVSIIARSGWGMYRDLGGNTANVLSSVYANTLGVTATPVYDFAREPDAVIINLGTNDSNPDDPGTGYEDAYVAFLGTVRSHYASAWIFLSMGPMTGEPLLTTMQTRIDSVVTRMADPRIVAVPLQTQDSSTTGCDYHPDVDEHARMAAALQAPMAASLGW